MNAIRWSVFYAIGSGLIGLAELLVGLFSGSMALIADSIHAVTDVITGLIGAVAAAIGRKQPDLNHPFGHSRAEPLGAFMVALITSLLGLNILQMGISSLLEQKTPSHGAPSFWVLFAVLLFKAGFYFFSRKKKGSTVLRALSIDSRNDCLASFATLVIIYTSSHGLPWLDQGFALIIGGIIVHSGFQIAKENVALLMGEIPGKPFFEHIYQVLSTHPEVLGYGDVKAHYVGLDIHLALTLKLDPHLSLAQAHDIEHRVTQSLMKFDTLTEVFVHIEPYQTPPLDGPP